MKNTTTSNPGSLAWTLLRISLGLLFLWAFFDKWFGLNYATKPGKAWIDGISPTEGFLKFGTHGPFVDLYHSLAGNVLVDWLFMAALLGLGLALTLGVAMRLACYAGAVLVLMMWAALLPPANHPFLDEHVIYFFVFLGFALSGPPTALSLNDWWQKLSFVKALPFLQ